MLFPPSSPHASATSSRISEAATEEIEALGEELGQIDIQGQSRSAIPHRSPSVVGILEDELTQAADSQRESSPASVGSSFATIRADRIRDNRLRERLARSHRASAAHGDNTDSTTARPAPVDSQDAIMQERDSRVSSSAASEASSFGTIRSDRIRDSRLRQRPPASRNASAVHDENTNSNTARAALHSSQHAIVQEQVHRESSPAVSEGVSSYGTINPDRIRGSRLRKRPARSHNPVITWLAAVAPSNASATAMDDDNTHPNTARSASVNSQDTIVQEQEHRRIPEDRDTAVHRRWCTVTNESVLVDGDVEVDEETVMQNQIINEEYKLWKKNAVYLYDIMFA